MKRPVQLSLMLPILAVLAFALAAFGWILEGKPTGDALFRALHVLSAGEDYDESSKWIGNPWIDVARGLGAIFFVLTALKALRLLLAKQWVELATRFSGRDLVFIGDHPIFAIIAPFLSATRSILWIAGAGAPNIDGVRVIPRSWSDDMARRFRVHRANTIVTGFQEDDLSGLAIARSLAGAAGAEIALISSHINQGLGSALEHELKGVRILSAEELTIRRTHEAFPPFELARQLGQGRIHALVIGCDRTGEAAIADLLLSSLTTFLIKPKVTIVDQRCESIQARLKLRAPELDQSVDLEFVDSGEVAKAHLLPIEALRKAAEQDPFTCAYVCLNGDQASLAGALALDHLTRREGWPLATIFFRQRESSLVGAACMDEFGRLVPTGGADDLADALGLLGGERDMLARQLHAAYRRAAPADAHANVDWAALPEDLRNANRQAVAHIPAKLASAGASLERWIHARRRRGGNDGLATLPALDPSPTTIGRLAPLEHERWMAERRLSGWRYGVVRDSSRRLHPDLVPFEQLPRPAQEYDERLIELLSSALAQLPR